MHKDEGLLLKNNDHGTFNLLIGHQFENRLLCKPSPFRYGFLKNNKLLQLNEANCRHGHACNSIHAINFKVKFCLWDAVLVYVTGNDYIAVLVVRLFKVTFVVLVAILIVILTVQDFCDWAYHHQPISQISKWILRYEDNTFSCEIMFVLPAETQT